MTGLATGGHLEREGVCMECYVHPFSKIVVQPLTLERLNIFFHSSSSYSLPNRSTLPMHALHLYFTDSEVFDALSSLGPTKSSGIGPKLIKHCALISTIFAVPSPLFS